MPTPAEQTARALTAIDIDNIPQRMKQENFWLLWRPVSREATHKISKVPLAGQAWQNKLLSYDDVIAQYQQHTLAGKFVGLGFAYNLSHLLVCIDLDSFSQDNKTLLNACNSYTEKSPSQTGAHTILALRSIEDKVRLAELYGAKAFKKKSDRDLFISSGFVTVTGDTIDYNIPGISTLSFEDVDDIFKLYFNPKISVLSIPNIDEDAEDEDTNTAIQTKVYPPAEVRQMLRQINVRALTDDTFARLAHPTELAVLDPDCQDEAREPWLTICQAVHSNFKGSADGLILLHEWSKTGAKYDKTALINAYESFSNDPRFLNNRKPVTIASLIALVKAQYPVMPDVSAKGIPIATIQNLETYLKFYKYQMRYNIISDEVETTLPKCILESLSFSSAQVDHDTAYRVIASELIKLKINTSGFASLRESIKDYAKLNSYSPIEEYFKSLSHVYDPKADPLSDLMNTIITQAPYDSPNAMADFTLFMRKWLIQVVAAACTSSKHSENVFNNILIFSGAQGIGKTKWVSSLFPEKIKRYCAGAGSLRVNQFRSDAVKQAMELQRTLICNINEIDVLFRAVNYSAFKQLLDENTSSVVLPYGRSATTMIRRTVFIGSTNQRTFLVDQTGNRRITLIPVEKLLYDHDIDTQQLWAHAMYWYRHGEKWWLEANNQAEATAIQRQTRINTMAMDIGEDYVIESLDAYFNIAAPINEYKTWTFKDIRDRVPGMDSLRLNSSAYRECLRTFTIWLSQTKHGRPLTKANAGRSQQYYLVPPLKSAVPTTTFKGIAIELREERPLIDENGITDTDADPDIS